MRIEYATVQVSGGRVKEALSMVGDMPNWHAHPQLHVYLDQLGYLGWELAGSVENWLIFKRVSKPN